MDNQAKVKAALIGGVALVGAALVWYSMSSGETQNDDELNQEL